MAITPAKWSHFNDSNRDKSPADASTINDVINRIIVVGLRQGLNEHDIGHLLAIVNLESGFNPNAANPTSSASGLGQFIDSTGQSYGLDETNRWDIDAQVKALVNIFKYDKEVASAQNLGDAGIYGAHHDGAAGVLKADAPGIELAHTKVLPKVAAYEALVKDKISSGEVDVSSGANNALRSAESVTSATTPTGHWEDTTQWDEMGNVIQSGPRVWVPDDTQTISPTAGAGAGRGKVNPPSVETGSDPSTVPSNHPTATQISADGTTAALPNGQVIHAGPGGKLDIDVDGILTVSRPAQGWANADGSAADIRQITTYEASGAQIGTSIAQQLSGEAAATENYSQRTIHVPQADGSTSEVQTHFQAGVGWVDESGQMVLSLKDAQAQYDAKAANPIAGVSAENDYLPSGPKGQDQAIPQTVKPADPEPHVQSEQGGDFQSALLDAFSKPSPSAGLGTAAQLASLDTGTVSDAGNGLADPQTTANHTGSPAQKPADTTDYAQANNAASILNLANSLSNLSHFSQLSDTAKLNSLVALYNQIDHLGSGLATLNNLPLSTGVSVGNGNLAGDMSTYGAGLSFINSLQGNDAIAQVSSAASFANAISGSNVVPIPGIMALNLLDSMQSGNAVSVLSSVVAFIPGWGQAASIVISVLGGSLLSPPPPPPPAGHVVFGWDESGQITHTLDFEQSKGGPAATQIAQSVQTLLENVVASINSQAPDASQHVALNPYRMPSISFADGHTWLYMEQADGNSLKLDINSSNLAQDLVQALASNGGLLPQWQVQTLQAHLQSLHESEAAPEQIAAERNSAIAEATMAGHTAQEGTQAFALQGNAVESADFKTQSFGALVVKIDAVLDAVQHHADRVQATAQDIASTHILKNTDSDAYLETTQWVSATDAQGKLQGILVIDHNNNGQIETSDILNLGGNAGQAGNATDEAQQASANAALQRNNALWLDANGDGMLNPGDPAFAAIKLWVDVQSNGLVDQDELRSLSSVGITSINLKTGEVTYSATDAHGQTVEGHTALTALTLSSETSGVMATHIQKVNADGRLSDTGAGEVIAHEGYQGQTYTAVSTDEAGNVTGGGWGKVREQTYEQQALRTGDWEGTADQEAHRHGGTNVAGAPSETNATGSTDLGVPLRVPKPIAQSTITAGDARVVSDAPLPAVSGSDKAQTNPPTNAQTVIAAGDIRIKSNVPSPNTAAAVLRPSVPPLGFVPSRQNSVQGQVLAVTEGMIESSQSALFSLGANAGLGVLTAVGLGAVQSAQAFERPMLVSDIGPLDASALQFVVTSANMFAPKFAGSLESAVTVGYTTASAFQHVDLGTFHVEPIVNRPVLALPAQNLNPAPTSTPQDQNPDKFTAAGLTASVFVTLAHSVPTSHDPASQPSTADSGTPNLLTLDYPEVQGETLPGTEDVVLRLTQSVLLANDRTINVSAYSDQHSLTITAVSSPQHGQVSLVNGEVLFAPDLNFHGTASFSYTVTDQYGLMATASATLHIAAANDAPVTLGETANSQEDTGLLITQAQLLANDSDVDVATDGQVLSISRVGEAQHGTVWLDGQGNLRFIPEANYHGPAQFIYWVSDGTAVNGGGAETPATVKLTVSAVNDMPVAVGETIEILEDQTLLIAQSALLQNDTDVDTVTDGQVLSITAVANAQHGAVTLHHDGTIAFVPDANFFGIASFDYTVEDGAGGTSIATAVLQIGKVNDAPVALGEVIQSQEDTLLTITAASLLQNDTDIDNPHRDLKIARVESGTHGSVILNANGDVVFTPDADYNNTDATQAATFTYWVKDPDGAESNPVTTKIMLSAVNDAPVAQAETVAGASEDAAFHIDKNLLLANDTDIDDAHNALSLSWVGGSTGGVVSLDVDGNVVFTPTANFNGNASFLYRVRDAAGLESATVQTIIPVASVNDAPVAVDDQFQTYNNATMTVSFNQLAGNDFDVDDQLLTVSAVRDHVIGGQTNGHAQIVNGQVQFVANPNFTGTAAFDYLSDDGHGGQTWATAYVDVKEAPNRYPTIDITNVSINWYNSQYVELNSMTVYFNINDDGNAEGARLQLVASSERDPDGWYDANGLATYGHTGNSAYLNVVGRSVLFESVEYHTYFNDYRSTWTLTDDRGLQNTWHFDFIDHGINNYEYRGYADHYGNYIPPVVLDLNGDGLHFTTLQNSRVSFDLNHDGVNDKIAWAGNDDGVLVWDKDRNGRISDASEFSFQSLKAGAQTDLEGLQALDTNRNGILDAGDEKFSEFGVWQDANGNGVADAGEFQTLHDRGIAEINLHSDAQMRQAGTALASSNTGETDVTFMGNSAFTRTDGSSGVAADAMFAFEVGKATHGMVEANVVTHLEAGGAQPLMDSAHLDAQVAEINRQALVFSQMCTTTFKQDEPLGFISISPELCTSADIVSLLHSASNDRFTSLSSTNPFTNHDASQSHAAVVVREAA